MLGIKATIIASVYRLLCQQLASQALENIKMLAR
jgi:hypothetical protein